MSNDATAIANLKARYCLAADTSTNDESEARAMFDGVFTDDFVGDYGFGTMEGPQAITDFMCKAISAGSEWMIHMLGSPRIVVDGNSATGDWTIHVESRRREGAGLMTVVGRYSDTFRKTSQGWKIASITFQRYE
ncbi:nuclear transport factor 2 family protein [Pontixanthobacter aquaemixtae]|uniref:Nuclear transport factor 2 family protein n=1 Tax=Pontixanthobacter aquaemixtae TaxID=1958940 RepID=A0A844ZQ36_9SPHN|nr:nuclear transport factor 2 family protein [Pontixanthobacter aquaemixtae]MXO89965.1 nuclear transport factor 2 family protein [Pontixanthobacter aquaemixtae]